MTNDDTLSRQIAIRLSEDDLRRLDRLTERVPIASRNAIARAALRLGLAALEKDPTLLFAEKKASPRVKK
jgi:hypothetical protein